jgi:outer membrane protein assembly factor BamB
VARFGPDGELVWSKTLGGTDRDEFAAVAAAADGGAIAAGLTTSGDGDFGPAKGGWDAVVARFGPDGELVWSKTLGGTGYDEFGAVAAAADGGAIAAGFTASGDGDFGPADGYGDAVVAWFGPDGELVWSKTLGGTDVEVFGAVAAAADGGAIAAGVTASGDGDFGPVKGEGDAVVARFGPDGELDWSKSLGGLGRDYFGAVAAAADGGAIAAGFTDSGDGDFGPVKGEGDAVVARFGPDDEFAPR